VLLDRRRLALEQPFEHSLQGTRLRLDRHQRPVRPVDPARNDSSDILGRQTKINEIV
jgi:hypothetical protein